MVIIEVDRVRSALRLNSNAFDEEITQLISSCILDLKDAGIEVENEEREDLVNTSVILYCKALFGLDNPKSEIYMNLYINAKTSLKNGRDYIE